jgi:hypothetical protein
LVLCGRQTDPSAEADAGTGHVRRGPPMKWLLRKLTAYFANALGAALWGK